ncbi:MAG: hypothetical protein FWE30_07920 [Bacteroidales bacterium]|nr:hypothetical protein [Bacteroidales bacterium]MCL2739355.1 hypothetical protein [Bacteroidales bacterium]
MKDKNKQKGDSVHVELLIGLSITRMPKRAFIMSTAMQEDDVSLDLPITLINGKGRHKAYCRLVALDRGPADAGLAVLAQRRAGHPFF